MYQAVFYNHDGKDKGTCYLRDSKKGWSVFKYYPQLYKLDPSGEFNTLFGGKCSPVIGKFDWNDPSILEKDIPKELSVLRDLYYNDDSPPESHNVVYLDIEIEILGALTPQTIREAKAKITSIALINNSDNKKYCWVLDEKNNLKDINNNDIQIIPCINEKQLLTNYLNKWSELDPTIVVSYNGDFFDIPYLYFRIKNILGDEYGLCLSPIKKINDNLSNYYSPITIGGVNSLDYMLLIKKYIMKEEPSYKLNDIGIKYAGIGKIEYQGSLDKLFQEDIDKFIEYNIRDVEIIKKLEEKLQFIRLTILICHLCHVPYELIYYNTLLNEGAILTYLKRKNIISPNKPTTTNKLIKEINIGDEIINQRGTPTIEGIVTYIEYNNKTVQIKIKSGIIKERNMRTIRKKEGYAGGILVEPIIGLHRWVFDEDVTSYYPFSIITLNIGIETILGRIVTENSNRNLWMSMEELKELPNNTKIDIEKLDKKTYSLKKTTTTSGELLKLIKENDITISANGVLFRNDKKSISAEVLEDWFKKRKEFKDKMKKAYKEGNEDEGDLYKMYQHSFKILLNSLYGSYAINSWRYSDGYKLCSSSITCTGQRLLSESIRFINKEIEKELIS